MLLCEVNVQGDSSGMPAPRGCPVVTYDEVVAGTEVG